MMGDGGKILRCAQNDRGEARNDGGRRRMTKEECCHSEERSDEESSGRCFWDEREDSSLRSE